MTTTRRNILKTAAVSIPALTAATNAAPAMAYMYGRPGTIRAITPYTLGEYFGTTHEADRMHHKIVIDGKGVLPPGEQIEKTDYLAEVETSYFYTYNSPIPFTFLTSADYFLDPVVKNDTFRIKNFKKVAKSASSSPRLSYRKHTTFTANIVCLQEGLGRDIPLRAKSRFSARAFFANHIVCESINSTPEPTAKKGKVTQVSAINNPDDSNANHQGIHTAAAYLTGPSLHMVYNSKHSDGNGSGAEITVNVTDSKGKPVAPGELVLINFSTNGGSYGIDKNIAETDSKGNITFSLFSLDTKNQTGHEITITNIRHEEILRIKRVNIWFS